MLTVGESQKKRMDGGDALAAQRHFRAQAHAARRRDYNGFNKDRHDLTSLDFQLGTGLFVSQLGRKLRSIIPGLHHERHPGDKNKAGFLVHAEVIAVGDWPWMPEWSVFDEVLEELPVYSPEKTTSKEGYEVELFKPGDPVMEILPTSFREVHRGWRTVLMRLIQAGYVSTTTIENVFGIPNRASWAKTFKFYSLQPRDFVL